MPWPRSSTRVVLALVGLALFSAGLAVLLRMGHSLSVDEPFTANAARLPWSQLRAIFRTDNIPFMYVLLRMWTAMFGESEIALRALPILAYALAVLMTGLAASGRGPLAAIAASALVVSSVRIGVTHAATVRPYALLAAVSAAVTLLSLASLDRSESRRSAWWRGAALAALHLLGLFTHPTYVFVLAACGLAGALAGRSIRTASAVAAGAALVLYGLLWGHVVRATLASEATSWMQPPRLADAKTAYLSLWGTGPGFMLAGALVVLGLSNRSRLRELSRDPQVQWIAAATFIGWVAPIALSLWRPVFLPVRTPVMLLPLTAVLVAFVLSALASRAAVLTLVGCFLIAASGQVIAAARAGDPAPSRASLQAILSEATCSDTIVAVGLANEPVDYYLRRLAAPACLAVEQFPASMLNWTRQLTDEAAMRRIEDEATALVARLSSRSGTIWVVAAEKGMGHEASAVFAAAARARLACGDPQPVRGSFFDHVTRCTR